MLPWVTQWLLWPLHLSPGLCHRWSIGKHIPYFTAFYPFLLWYAALKPMMGLFRATISSLCLNQQLWFFAVTATQLCSEFRSRVLKVTDGNGGALGEQEVMPLGWARSWGLGPRIEDLRRSPQTMRGFQSISKTEPKWGVPGQSGLSLSASMAQVSPWGSASIGWLFWGPLPLGHLRAGCLVSALEALAFMTDGW